MEVGQSGKIIGAVIQARMQSTRLPGKILMPLPAQDGKPLLQWVVDSLKECKLIDKIILATSLNPENDILEEFAETNYIYFFRGSENDVLSRFVEVTEIHKLETIVRITGDNPILDSSLLDQLISHHLFNDNDCTYSTDLPLGMNLEIVKAELLKGITKNDDATPEDREHVTYYIKRTGKYKTDKQALLSTSLIDKIRLTVDYPADYALINLLLTYANKYDKKGMELINWINENHNWMWEINNSLYQKKNYSSINEEIIDAVEILEKYGLNQTAKMLKSKL
jgi:spore coat polysaccharide biosynthesis protein SpsF